MLRVLLVGVAACLGAICRADPVPGSMVGATELETRSGAPMEFAPKEVTIVSFFAFWCNTWKQQCPRLSTAMGELGGFPVKLLTVSVDGRWSNVSGFDPALPLALDRQGWSHSLGVDRVPTTIILDSNGMIRWVKSGVVRTEELVEEAKRACSTLSSARVHLRIANFPPEEGGFQILDELRRFGVHAELETTETITPEQRGLVKEAVRQGYIVVRAGKKAGPVIDGYDESRPGAGELLRRLLEGAGPGSTILLHANVRQSRTILPELIHDLKARGFALE